MAVVATHRRRTSPMAVCATDLALCRLVLQRFKAVAAKHELDDGSALRPHVVEVEDNRIRLAAVDAGRRRENFHEPSDVATNEGLHAGETRFAQMEPQKSAAPSCPPAVAVHAHDLAFRDLPAKAQRRRA